LLEARAPAAGTARVFQGLGHQPQCGRCARTIPKIMDEVQPAGNTEWPRRAR
jgi:bacterioferritin-associated ferredoxin